MKRCGTVKYLQLKIMEKLHTYLLMTLSSSSNSNLVALNLLIKTDSGHIIEKSSNL